MNADPNKYYNAQGILAQDPTKVINTIPGQTITTTTSDGIFSRMSTILEDPWVNPLKIIEDRITKLETENKFLRLKILSIEGKFTQEEVTNIRKMLMSNDEASKTLADSIIENA
jgi:hypothetical protein